MRKKKKLTVTLVLATCILGAAVNVSALSTKSTNSGGINLDPFINGNLNAARSIQSTSQVVASSANGGGTFSVEYGLDRHTAYYNHPSKEHLASVSNYRSTIRSDWEPATVEASAWIKSSLWGNTANWQTR